MDSITNKLSNIFSNKIIGNLEIVKTKLSHESSKELPTLIGKDDGVQISIGDIGGNRAMYGIFAPGDGCGEQKPVFEGPGATVKYGVFTPGGGCGDPIKPEGPGATVKYGVFVPDNPIGPGKPEGPGATVKYGVFTPGGGCGDPSKPEGPGATVKYGVFTPGGGCGENQPLDPYAGMNETMRQQVQAMVEQMNSSREFLQNAKDGKYTNEQLQEFAKQGGMTGMYAQAVLQMQQFDGDLSMLVVPPAVDPTGFSVPNDGIYSGTMVPQTPVALQTPQAPVAPQDPVAQQTPQAPFALPNVSWDKLQADLLNQMATNPMAGGNKDNANSQISMPIATDWSTLQAQLLQQYNTRNKLS